MHQNQGHGMGIWSVSINGCPVIWETKLTTLVCLSTAEAEYVAAVQATKTALWLAQMFAELQSISVPQIHILEDNQACIKMAENPEVSARNRHFAMRMWWLRDMVNKNSLSFTYIPSEFIPHYNNIQLSNTVADSTGERNRRHITGQDFILITVSPPGYKKAHSERNSGCLLPRIPSYGDLLLRIHS